MLEELKEEIDYIRDEEQEAFDSFPESLQCSERGEKMESAIDALDYASNNIQECLDNLTEAQE